MADVTLVFLEDCYYLRAHGEESEECPYGEPLDCTIGGHHYIASVDIKESTDDVESRNNEWVYEVASVPEVEIIEEDEGEEEAEVIEVDEEPEEVEK